MQPSSDERAIASSDIAWEGRSVMDIAARGEGQPCARDSVHPTARTLMFGHVPAMFGRASYVLWQGFFPPCVTEEHRRGLWGRVGTMALEVSWADGGEVRPNVNN